MSEYNIYCDESCHLEHDGESHMIIGGIKCPKEHRRTITRELYLIKESFGMPKLAEIKWNKVSNSNIEYFKAVVKYFFDSPFLEFRAVIVDKSQLRHDDFNQTHDEFYYKMYYQLLIRLLDPNNENYIYLDKKDTRGTSRINHLRFYLSQKTHDFDQSKVNRIQCVNSEELPILQIADLLIGAVGYHNRNIKHESQAKVKLVEYIQTLSHYSLEKSTFPSEKKFNLFFINLK